MNSQKILLVKGIAGMGNRILFALTADLYARLSGRRLFIDWSDPLYSSDRQNVFHRLFVHPECKPNFAIPKTDSVFPPTWQGRLYASVNEVVSAHEPKRVGEFLTFKDYSAD